jgi:aspartyl-tRNA(Asn)/glutamyl-tRNA(Gln) amidotransferase subunit A
MTIAEIGRRLRAREVTIHELTQAALDAAERSTLNAFVTITGEQALQRADELDAMLGQGIDLGPLHGIPVAHKDCIYTKGVRTTGGSKLLANFVPERDAEIVRRLHAEGMVMIGKSGLHEFTYGISNVNPHFGPVLNPHDATRVSGGSSGGSGAAVAAGIVPVATGTDTGGSIRIPASFCGCVGLKPTYGRVSREGVMALGPSQDHVGPLAATVADCAEMYGALAGVAAGNVGGGNISDIRIGVPENYFWDNLAPEVRFATRGAVQVIAALGAQVREVRVPDAAPLNEIGRLTLLCEAASTLLQYSARSEDFGDDVWALIERGRSIPAVEYLNAQRERELLTRDFAQLWTELDCLILPTTPMTAFTIDAAADQRAEATRLTRPFNLLGWPALSLPCGVSPTGLPIGIQLVAAPGGEDTLFRAGAALEAGVRIPIKTARS